MKPEEVVSVMPVAPMSEADIEAAAALVTIQDLLGHTRIKTTQRYCRVSNLKVQRDDHRAMAAILQITEITG